MREQNFEFSFCVCSLKESSFCVCLLFCQACTFTQTFVGESSKALVLPCSMSSGASVVHLFQRVRWTHSGYFLSIADGTWRFFALRQCLCVRQKRLPFWLVRCSSFAWLPGLWRLHPWHSAEEKLCTEQSELLTVFAVMGMFCLFVIYSTFLRPDRYQKAAYRIKVSE